MSSECGAGILDEKPYRIDFTDHAEQRLRERYWEVWTSDGFPFERVELVDPAPYELFKESVEVVVPSEFSAKYHPLHEIVFVYKKKTRWTGVVITVVYPSKVQNLEDMPRCPVCGNVMVAKLHDPCPFCDDVEGRYAD